MKAHGLRYSVITTEDVENLEAKWDIDGDSLTLKNVSGHLETRLIEPLPPALHEVLKDISHLRISFRHDMTMGDLLQPDTFSGMTIEYYPAVPVTTDTSSSLSHPHIESLKLAELLIGQNLEYHGSRSRFIDMDGLYLYHSTEASSEVFFKYLQAEFPDLTDRISSSLMVELDLDANTATRMFRSVSTMPNQVSFTTGSLLSTEVGIVQRQKRSLSDSEFKGLSTYLPASDLDPFMIFFDQRVRPDVESRLSTSTKFLGNGSHLSFYTTFNVEKDSQGSHVYGKAQDECRLFTEYRLPKQYFFDIFELEQVRLGEFRIFGEHDLEDPIWKTGGWGSMLLLEHSSTPFNDTIVVQFHARYLEPRTDNSFVETTLLAPQSFWSCKQTDAAFTDNPWDFNTLKGVLLGDDHYFRILNNSGPSRFTVLGAAADSVAEAQVMWITYLTILFGFFYIIWKAIKGPLTRSRMP